jgi:hypothetical protein
MKRLLLTAALVVTSLCTVAGQELEYSGFLDTYYAVRANKPNDTLSLRSRLRLESTLWAGDFKGYISINAEKNGAVEANSGITLREAFLQYSANSWDVTIGRQIIIWGQADGMQITDIISPWDNSEFLARDFDDLRLGVDAVRGRLLLDSVTIEALIIPRFRPAILPDADSPWAFPSLSIPGIQIEMGEAEEPEVSLENSEYGLRASFFLPQGDFAIMALRTWNDMAAHEISFIENQQVTSIFIKPEYYRINVYGAEFSVPKGNFVFRGEGAIYQNMRFDPDLSQSVVSLEKNMLRWMLGTDFPLWGGISGSVQVINDLILDYDQQLAQAESYWIYTASLSKNLLRESLQLAAFGFYGPADKESFLRFSADYAYTGNLHLLGGYDYIDGQFGFIGMYHNNDEFWLKAKYSF